MEHLHPALDEDNHIKMLLYDNDLFHNKKQSVNYLFFNIFSSISNFNCFLKKKMSICTTLGTFACTLCLVFTF